MEWEQQQTAAHQAGGQVAVEIMIRLEEKLREEMQADQPIGLRHVQHEHRQDHTSLAFAHVKLRDSTGVLDQETGNAKLHTPDLKSLLDLEDEPLGMISELPFATNVVQLALKFLRVALLGEIHHPLELIFKHAQLEPL